MVIPNFVLLLYTLTPTLPSAPLLTHAKTVLLQLYQIQLHLRTVELHCDLRDNVISLVNSMGVLEKEILQKLIENL